MTVKQLNSLLPNADGDGFTIDGKQANHVRLIARLNAIDDLDSGSINVRVNDSTGMVK